MKKQTIFTICSIMLLILGQSAWGENIDQNVEWMPEFCVASFLVTGNGDEADKWYENYDINKTMVAFIQYNLETMIQNKEVRGEEISAAVAGCISAANEEEQTHESTTD